MEKTKNYLEWQLVQLQEVPIDEDIAQHGDDLHIPIPVIETYLDRIFGASFWSTCNFGYSKTILDETSIEIDGIIELSCTFANGEKITRVGAVTYITSKYDQNKNNSATAKSLAIKNAAKGMGRIMGRHLNDRATSYMPFVKSKESDENAHTIDEETAKQLTLKL